MRRFSLAVCGLGLVVGLSGSLARAEWPCCGERKLPSCMTRWWSTKSLEHTLERAGHPEEVSRCAAPTDTGHYVGYYVGGGCPVCGDGPEPCEGTWGWDYCGRLVPRRIFLHWSHGKCYQGGTGAYKTDGPRLPEREKKCEP